MNDITLKALLAQQSPEDREEIHHMAEELVLEWKLGQIREELQLSQQQIAEALGISQPSVVAMEKRGNDIKLSSIKRYVEAMGGKLNLAVSLPTGKTVSFQI